MTKTRYKGSYITTIKGDRYHIHYTYEHDENGKMVNEKETKRVKL